MKAEIYLEVVFSKEKAYRGSEGVPHLNKELLTLLLALMFRTVVDQMNQETHKIFL